MEILFFSASQLKTNIHKTLAFLQQFFHEHVEIAMYVLLTDFTQLFSDTVSKGCNEIKW